MDVIELIKVVTNLLWPIFAFVLFFTFRKPVGQLLSRLKKGKILGSEFELNEPLTLLDQAVTQSAADVKALPNPEPIFKGIASSPIEYSVVEQVLSLAAHSPKAALLLLASEIERALGILLGSLGLLDRDYVPVKEATNVLEQRNALPKSVASSVDLFMQMRNRLIHGGAAASDDILRAIDSGITILKTIEAIPRGTHLVVRTNIDLYGDSLGSALLLNVKGVMIETSSPTGLTKNHSVFATTQTHFKEGMRVAWQWGPKQFSPYWYKDPSTQQMHGPIASMEFTGRKLND